MIVYISGTIINNEEKFQEARLYLESLGHIVLDPSLLPSDMPAQNYTPIRLAMLEQSEAIYMLTDFRDSELSTMELEYAAHQNKKIFFE